MNYLIKNKLGEDVFSWRVYAWCGILACLLVMRIVEGHEVGSVDANFWATENDGATTTNFGQPQVVGQPQGIAPTYGKLVATNDKEVLQVQYVKKYLSIAQLIAKKYHVPVSIQLAQGLLESRAGMSSLAKKANNHFGVKCFSRTCKKGHCMNFSDDSHKDFFKTYKNVWRSYIDHAKHLKGIRYRKLFLLKAGDYKGWAQGLQDAGYATSDTYAKDLIWLVERYGLDKIP
jgi:flagellum-specific peptidoglycan hydrolase FlgJ